MHRRPEARHDPRTSGPWKLRAVPSLADAAWLLWRRMSGWAEGWREALRHPWTVSRRQEGLGVADVPDLLRPRHLTPDAPVLGETKINSDRNLAPLCILCASCSMGRRGEQVNGEADAKRKEHGCPSSGRSETAPPVIRKVNNTNKVWGISQWEATTAGWENIAAFLPPKHKEGQEQCHQP